MPAQLHDISDRFNGIDCLEEIPAFRLVKLVAENNKLGWRLCGPADIPSAISGAISTTPGSQFRPNDMTMYNLRAAARFKCEFETDCDLGAKVYVGSAGRVTKTPASGAVLLGVACKKVESPRGTGEKMVCDQVYVAQTAESLSKYTA